MTSRRKTSQRLATFTDRAAHIGITAGGVMIIGTVILMLLLIFNVSIPLFKNPTVESIRSFSLNLDFTVEPLTIGIGDYREIAYAVYPPNEIAFYDALTGTLIEVQELEHPSSDENGEIVAATSWGNHQLTLRWSTGQISLAEVVLRPIFDKAGERSISYRLESQGVSRSDSQNAVINTVLRLDEDANNTLAVQNSDNSITITKIKRIENFLGEIEEETTSTSITSELPGTISVFTVDDAGKSLYLGTTGGYVAWWDIADLNNANMVSALHVNNADVPVTALNLVFGDVSIAVGTEDGSVGAYFATQDSTGARTNLKLIHRLLELPSSIVSITSSRRDKALLVLDNDGVLHSVHMTSERYLLKLPAKESVVRYALSSKGNTILSLEKNNTLTLWNLERAHPEISFKTLFSKIWYEKYDEPDYVWQSSASSDDYEPKLSLTPLIFGSFKGTLYAMLFAVPLALLGALYTNQFLSPGVRAVVKPAVEIMASIPSVVIGFLVALWLAPVIESFIVTFMLSLVVVPLTTLPFLYAGHRLDGTDFYRKVERGYEFIIAAPIIILGCYLSYLLAPSVESILFQGDFKLWIYESLNIRYDQRNAIIIAFGLGFVSIPIIFTISEDAMSNLPASLRAASLALGASRWQTAWRVVLPSASPGIFAAIIIGFGRVIGETMIVLMATGNTPIIDWSPFNGMRTLSANIAVEIPEAPVDGTLYRVLFLSAALLFMLTFTLNTIAELVRQRLRNKYGRFQ